MKKLLWMCVLASCFHVSICCGDEKDEAASLVRASCANAEAIRRFDVLIQQENLEDTKSMSRRETTFIRFRADLDKLCVLAARHTRHVEQELREKQTIDPVRKLRVCGMVWRDGAGYFHEVPDRVEPIESNYTTVLRDQNIPDLRLVGILPYPSTFPRKDEPSGFDVWRTTQLKPPVLCVTATAGGLTTTTLRSRQVGREGHHLVTTWQFDQSMLVSTRVDLRREVVVDAKVKVIPMQWQQISWEMRAGVYVPVKIIGDKKVAGNAADSSHVDESTVYLHWFSVNEKLKDEDFEKQLIESEKDLLKLTDPKQNGVKSHISQ